MQQQLAECRVSERHSCQVPTSCAPAAANETRWDATIENVSRTGFRLRLGRRFEPRTSLAIELPGKDGRDPYTVYVKVVHVRREDDGTYALGCKLLSELSDEELQRLLSAGPAADDVPAEDAPAPERTMIRDVRLAIEAGTGRLVRCRVKRFHVAGAWPLAPGSAVDLRGRATDGSQLEHRFAVIGCSRQGEGWNLRVEAADAAAGPAWLDA